MKSKISCLLSYLAGVDEIIALMKIQSSTLFGLHCHLASSFSQHSSAIGCSLSLPASLKLLFVIWLVACNCHIVT